MVGYVESLTDPSYCRQLLVLTYPLIGNYGVPSDELDQDAIERYYESRKIWVSGLVVSEACDSASFSHWNAKFDLSSWLRKFGIPGIAGVDTRLLTKRIREYGSMEAKLVINNDDPLSYEFLDINERNLVAEVSRHEVCTIGDASTKPLVLVVDCGIKNNQIRCLLHRGAAVKIVPWNYPIAEESKFISMHDIWYDSSEVKHRTSAYTRLIGYYRCLAKLS
ncbi:unnamed protein product [Soboliphyme baturini]|uniref:CPSase_sm_chain domain-containing protein n=1 Tax=Soboliphyme baturini TaxID=241478 RepID=A0A183IYG7_9BILA|nr:unnamed protein product [Soboliphyme baturini]